MSLATPPLGPLTTPLTTLLKIKHPVLLAGMNKAAGPELAAAVTNAGGLGVIGGLSYAPRMLQILIDDLKSRLDDPEASWGVDLLLPQVGKGARATNHDYTNGQLPALIDIIATSGAKLFVSAVGVPPQWAVDKLHQNGVLVMNMVGAPRHVEKALSVGVDIICAQGSEGGGHTGEVATSILVPACVDICRNAVSLLSGSTVPVVAAGGIFDGRGLAAALMWGAQAVWVGTRFVCSTEATAPEVHVNGILGAGLHDTARTLVYTGRPMRVLKRPYTESWEVGRREEMMSLLAQGIVPVEQDMTTARESDTDIDPETFMTAMPLLMGQVAGLIHDVKPAALIVQAMVEEAVMVLREARKILGGEAHGVGMVSRM